MIRGYREEDRNRVLEIGRCLDGFDLDKCSTLDKIYVYVEKKMVLGFVVYREMYEIIELLYIAVDKEFRKRSIGRKLLEYLYKDDIEKIILEVSIVNENAIKFYKSLGFKELRTIKNYYDGVIDAISMEKVIM